MTQIESETPSISLENQTIYVCVVFILLFYLPVLNSLSVWITFSHTLHHHRVCKSHDWKNPKRHGSTNSKANTQCFQSNVVKMISNLCILYSIANALHFSVGRWIYIYRVHSRIALLLWNRISWKWWNFLDKLSQVTGWVHFKFEWIEIFKISFLLGKI